MTARHLFVEIDAERRYWLDRPTYVGKSRRCGIRLTTDAYVSMEHALLRPTTQGWQVMDMGSTNGVWLRPAGSDGPREQRAYAAYLSKGDRLRIGRTTMVVVPT